MAYDENGNPLSRRTPRGVDFTWRSEFDGVDRVVAEVSPLGEKASYGYDAVGNVVLERSPRGNALAVDDPQRVQYETTREFNASNELIKETDGLGRVSTFSYDEDGHQISAQTPGARPQPGGNLVPRLVARTFDGRGLPWAETTTRGGESHTTVTEFDGNGNLVRSVNAKGVEAGWV